MAAEDSINMGVVMRRLRADARDMPLSVLLVEDDDIERAVLAALLQAAGLEVGTAGNAEEALGALEQRDFPVALIDWHMPQVSGIDLVEQLRARGHEDIYLIMLTARDGENDIERGYLAGVDDYVSKRVRNVELLARVHTGLRTSVLRREVRVLRGVAGQ